MSFRSLIFGMGLIAAGLNLSPASAESVTLQFDFGDSPRVERTVRHDDRGRYDDRHYGRHHGWERGRHHGWEKRRHYEPRYVYSEDRVARRLQGWGFRRIQFVSQDSSFYTIRAIDRNGIPSRLKVDKYSGQLVDMRQRQWVRY